MTIEISDEEKIKDDPIFAMSEAIKVTSRPNYFAVVPAFVRYNKSLTYLEKILYAEITALSNKFGYCFADNKYFADNFGNSEVTVRRSIKHLADLGFISVFMEKMSDQTVARKIFLSTDNNGVAPENEQRSRTKIVATLEKKQSKDGLDKPDLEDEGAVNNITVNNTNISISKDIVDDVPVKPVTSPVQPLPTWLGKTPLLRILTLYEMLFEYTVGSKHPKINISSIESSIIKKLINVYGEAFSALCVIIHFDWRGLSGTDENINKRLKDSGFPIRWISGSAPLYDSFIKNVLRISNEKEAIEKISEVLLTITQKND